MQLLKPPIAIPIFILCSFAAAAHAADTRFSGSAALGKPLESTTSATGQFSLRSEMRPTSAVQSSGRFDLSAKLQPDPTAIATTCGPVNDLIFKNGFDL